MIHNVFLAMTSFICFTIGYFLGFLICQYNINQKTGFEPTINDLMKLFEETKSNTPKPKHKKEKE